MNTLTSAINIFLGIRTEIAFGRKCRGTHMSGNAAAVGRKSRWKQMSPDAIHGVRLFQYVVDLI